VKPVWSPEAIEDMRSLHAYIAEDDPATAVRVAQQIVPTVVLLSKNPEMGRPGRVSGTRELVIPRTPFIVPYRVQGKTLQVLRVYHGARRWPERF
jgi:toxin ParE1/3/4